MLGYHLSSGGTDGQGLKRMFDMMVNINILSVQTYVRNPRQRGSKTRKFNNIDKYSQYVVENGINFFTHSPLTTNLIYQGINKRSCYDIINDLRFNEKIGGRGTVVHIGSGPDDYINNLIKHLSYIFKKFEGEAKIFLENQAQCGKKRLVKIDEIINVWKHIKKNALLRDKVEFCIDTCHLYVGHDINSKQLLKNFMKLNGEIPIGVVHFNGAMKHRKDEHDYPIHGLIDVKCMKKIYQICTDQNIPMIIEMYKVFNKKDTPDVITEYANVLTELRSFQY